MSKISLIPNGIRDIFVCEKCTILKEKICRKNEFVF